MKIHKHKWKFIGFTLYYDRGTYKRYICEECGKVKEVKDGIYN